MSTSTLQPPTAAKPPHRTLSQWDELLARYEALDADRKRLNREAKALERELEPMAEDLLAFLDAKAGGKEQIIKLRRFLLWTEFKPPSSMARAFAALKLLSPAQREQLEESLHSKKTFSFKRRFEEAAEAA